MDSDSAKTLNTLGNALVQQRRLDEAVNHFREALRLQPDFAVVHNNLGNALAQQGKLEEAVTHYSEAVRQRPDLAGAHDNLGCALKSLGKLDEAVASFREALRVDPDFVDAHTNLGDALVELGRFGEAEARFRHAHRLRPDDARVHNNLGHVLFKLGRPEEAEPILVDALRLSPGYPEALNNLGNVLSDLGRHVAAEACYRDAIRLAPDSSGAYNNLGNVLADRGRFVEAVASYDHALRIRPGYQEARKNRGQTLLAAGDYARGFADFEARFHSSQHTGQTHSGPRWQGEPLDGRKILLHTEQGFGDTIQFIRFAALVQDRGGRVLVECDPPIVRLLSGCPGIDRLIAIGAPLPKFDFQAPLMSLASILGTTLETLPARIPYLFADSALVERWRPELAAIPGFKVGIAWQGNPKYPLDRFRSMPLAQFEPLAQIPGVRLISVQKGPGTEQLCALGHRFPVIELSGFDESAGAFTDTAAIMKHLDLVITSDSAVAHLAGALGIPAWVALPRAPDWRWLRGREDSPWYPTLRLFRQTETGKWSNVFERMAEQLRARLTSCNRVTSVSIEVSPGELLDRIAMLEVQRERIEDTDTRGAIERELAALRSARDRAITPDAALLDLMNELRATHSRLFHAEDEARRCEQHEIADLKLFEFSRTAARENDHRADLKRRINTHFGN